jgi:hypothetical protein
MADELKTGQREEVTAEELTAQFGEKTGTGEGEGEGVESTTKTEAPTSESEYDFEYTSPDGSVEKLTSSQMAERLANYRKLQSEYGKTKDEVAEYKRRVKEYEDRFTPAGTRPTATDGQQDLTDADMEDPEILRKVLKQNAEFSEKLKNLPREIEEKAQERETIQEMQRVMATHPRLKKFKNERLREAIVRNASVFAVARNQEVGQIVYADLDSAVDGFFTLLQGEQESVTQQAFVRSLKSPSQEVLPAGGGKAIGDVVKRYAQLKSPEERANFLTKLTDEEVKIIDAAVYAGEIK